MRFFVAGIATESNGFVSYPTPLCDFHRYHARPGRPEEHEKVLSAAGTWLSLIEEGGHELVPGLCAWAWPSGPTTRSAYEHLRDEVLSDLRGGLPVDAVLLDLHGAMVADGYPDAEGDLIEGCRAAVGPNVPVGVFLDHHCHLTRRMVEHATVIVAMKEWPHIDVPDRSREVFDLVVKTVGGHVAPTMALFDCRMIGAYPTRRDPMRAFVNRLTAVEAEPGVLSVSLGHGYPWADVPEVGSKMLVVTDGDRAGAARWAERLGREFFELRHDLTERADMGIDEALDYAHSVGHRPVVLCEQPDNHLGGSAGDATFVLQRVVERGVEDVLFGPIWDPMSVDICGAVGEGENLLLRIGAKSGPEAGDPVDLRVTVRKVIQDLRQGPLGDIQETSFGRAVWVRAKGDVDIVLHSKRAGTLRPDVFAAFGLDVARKKIAVCKMWRHGAHGFADVADDFKIIATPGTQTLDFASIPFKVFAAPYWPRVEDPFADHA
ncbi:MAG: M81 family metallopeptidase [Gemmatimonadota bacterium]|nr:M81 family metallopeptidase [Gemmatimonadota bacterium]